MSSICRSLVAGSFSFAVGMAAVADPIPEGYRGENIEVVGYVDAAGSSPFKMSLLQDGDTWYMYTSNLESALQTSKEISATSRQNWLSCLIITTQSSALSPQSFRFSPQSFLP